MKSRKNFYVAISFIALFALWTVLVCIVDVQPIGPWESKVGFSTLNGFVHDITGVHMSLYTITDWLGLVPIAVALSFAVLGIAQLIKRKSIFKVDRSIIALGIFYIVVMSVYALFEVLVVNYRPVLIEGCLEASYPSSTTMLVICVMSTAIMQLSGRIKNRRIRIGISVLISAFIVFMVALRLISGVHWFTDIVGGTLISVGLVMLYFCI